MTLSAITVPAIDGGSLDAVMALPNTGSGPGLVVLHEIFGMTDFIKDQVRFFADRGYAVIAPDLYWRVAPGAVFDYQGEGFEQALATRNRLDDDRTVADVGNVVRALSAMPACQGGVAVVGYCLGGLLTYLAAGRLDIAAAVSFHGVRIETRLAEAATLAAPLLLHFAGRDGYVTQDAVAKVKLALNGRPDVEIYDYPEADHGFTRRARPSFHARSAELAHARTFALLERALAAPAAATAGA